MTDCATPLPLYVGVERVAQRADDAGITLTEPIGPLAVIVDASVTGEVTRIAGSLLRCTGA